MHGGAGILTPVGSFECLTVLQYFSQETRSTRIHLLQIHPADPVAHLADLHPPPAAGGLAAALAAAVHARSFDEGQNCS